ncbi:hypothetical protein [Massilia endophytica]|uniref:hypothetical protein n=1 Tax=Massilia endophytica TaxID=2899220 RepID=UPI001E322A2B|nr:hypothetical protein [Massilia endophytica]UGQ46906.1 hypothetical protein LSQ66_24640 [Massilia endophytica]
MTQARAMPAAVSKRLLHALSGSLLASFIVFHLFNHALAALDVGWSLAVMDRLRLVYRWPPVEGLLLACVLFQLASGPALAQGRRRSVAKLSGFYLLVFLAIHVSAVMWGRWGMRLDTNFYFAAAGLHVWPFAAFFYPYYFLAVVAVALHLGSALSRRRGASARTRILWCSGLAGVLLSGVILAAMAGIGNNMPIPDNYLRTYQ